MKFLRFVLAGMLLINSNATFAGQDDLLDDAKLGDIHNYTNGQYHLNTAGNVANLIDNITAVILDAELNGTDNPYPTISSSDAQRIKVIAQFHDAQMMRNAIFTAIFPISKIGEKNQSLWQQFSTLLRTSPSYEVVENTTDAAALTQLSINLKAFAEGMYNIFSQIETSMLTHNMDD